MMKTKTILYAGLLFIAASYTACRERRFNNYMNKHCPGTNSKFPVEDSAVIAFPNAFSPNGDGLNDIWKPVFNEYIVTVEFKVINAAGKVIFNSNGLHDGWNLTNDSGKGMEKNLVWVKATSAAGNVVEHCLYIYTYYCLPKRNAPISADKLLFGDQINFSVQGDYVPTQEHIDFCD